MAKDLLSVVRETKYPLDAFLFVQRGLDFTVRRAHGEPTPGTPTPGSPAVASATPEAIGGSGVPKASKTERSERHVTGKTLCFGLRDYAIDQYGLLARTVLRRWRITTCEDFGHIVFAMVEAGLMNKTAEDSIRDFIGVFSFDEAFADSVQLSENN
jgi:uncharacterized repeat protein (TIGR04138 family)